MITKGQKETSKSKKVATTKVEASPEELGGVSGDELLEPRKWRFPIAVDAGDLDRYAVGDDVRATRHDATILVHHANSGVIGNAPASVAREITTALQGLPGILAGQIAKIDEVKSEVWIDLWLVPWQGNSDG